MAKESLEMLFRELKTLESSSTDATQVYQVATHTCTHCTVNIESYECAFTVFHASSLPCSTLPSSSPTLQPPHHTTTSHSHCGFAPIPPSPTLSSLFLLSPHLISHPTHLLLPTSLPPLPSPPLPSPPTDCRSSGCAAGPRAYCVHPHPLALGGSEGDQSASGVWLTGHNEDLWHD